MDDVLYTEKQTAALLNVPYRTLQGWRQRGDGPRWIKLKSLVRYRLSDIQDYLDDSLKGPQLPIFYMK